MLRTRSTRFAVVLAGTMAGSLFTSAMAPPYPPLPETVTSFGAVTCDGWWYVFGGHKGTRHDYSVEMVSGSFQRQGLKDGQVWERLPSAPPGQGQPLVAHGGCIYRIGGMAARNHAGAKLDLYSMSLVQRYDPSRQVWEDSITPRASFQSRRRCNRRQALCSRRLATRGRHQQTCLARQRAGLFSRPAARRGGGHTPSAG